MAKAGRIHHWKHGWIPLSPEAKAFVAGRGPNPTDRDAALDVRGFDDLSPSLQGKIGAKLESQTGIPEPELAARVQDNLVRLYRSVDQSEAGWYGMEGAQISQLAGAVRADFPDSPLTRERLTGMIAVTSAKKRWKENKDFAEGIARKLAADQAFSVTPDMIHDYNTWAAKRRGGADGLARPHPELKPGTYRPSELPVDFAASQTPGMPKSINTDAVIAAAAIYRGEMSLDDAIQGPKQRSFVNNLMDDGDDRFVTVDTWHYRAAMSGIPLTRTIGPKGHQQTYTYTLEQWTDRDLARKDGRAAMYGYDPSKGLDDANLAAIKKAADNWGPQMFFQGGPEAKADNWRGTWGTYPWFVKQTQLAADKLRVSPNALQAVAWYAVGGGA